MTRELTEGVTKEHEKQELTMDLELPNLDPKIYNHGFHANSN